MNEKLTDLTMPLDDIAELDDDFFANADIYQGNRLIKKGRPRQQKPKIATTLRLDPKIIEFFKADGKGYQTRINQVLLDYIATHST